jgi:hypothetical protein
MTQYVSYLRLGIDHQIPVFLTILTQSSSPSSQSGTPADGWNEAFEKLKTLDEFMQKDYKEDIDTLLVFVRHRMSASSFI